MLIINEQILNIGTLNISRHLVLLEYLGKVNTY